MQSFAPLYAYELAFEKVAAQANSYKEKGRETAGGKAS